MMPDGLDYKLIVNAGMLEYFDFRPLSGFVYTNNQIKGLPLNFKDAVTSGMLGLFQVPKFIKFITNVQQYDPNNPSTHFFSKLDTAVDCLKKYGFTSTDQISWASYAFALHQDQKESLAPAEDSILNIQTYMKSCMMLKDFTKDTYSPFMYISFGSGEFCQGCARKSSVYGGTYRLNCDLKQILFNDQGKVRGVIFYDGMIENKDIEVECKSIILDPELAPEEYCEKNGTIVRKVIISKQPIVGTKGKSCQIILPPDPKVGKISVTYMCQLSDINNVCPQGYYIIVISTKKNFLMDKTNVKDFVIADKIVQGLRIVDTLHFSSPIYKPKPGLDKKGIFISNGCDSSTHFQHQIKDAFEIATKVKNYLSIN
ncbi:MAG: Rab GDP dissociation inhibitor alpha [Marteilia pararefringens]